MNLFYLNKIIEKIGKVVTALFLILIYVYRYVFSPVLPGACRFYPSCSIYSIESFKKYGPIKGLYLTVRRILRCNPYHQGGYDPVPETFNFFK